MEHTIRRGKHVNPHIERAYTVFAVEQVGERYHTIAGELVFVPVDFHVGAKIAFHGWRVRRNG